MSWTLEDARNDYRNKNPKCSACKFHDHKLEMSYDIYGIDRDYEYCKVKDIEIKDKYKCAEMCKYYTVK